MKSLAKREIYAANCDLCAPQFQYVFLCRTIHRDNFSLIAWYYFIIILDNFRDLQGRSVSLTLSFREAGSSTTHKVDNRCGEVFLLYFFLVWNFCVDTMNLLSLQPDRQLPQCFFIHWCDSARGTRIAPKSLIDISSNHPNHLFSVSWHTCLKWHSMTERLQFPKDFSFIKRHAQHLVSVPCLWQQFFLGSWFMCATFQARKKT